MFNRRHSQQVVVGADVSLKTNEQFALTDFKQLPTRPVKMAFLHKDKFIDLAGKPLKVKSNMKNTTELAKMTVELLAYKDECYRLQAQVMQMRNELKKKESTIAELVKERQRVKTGHTASDLDGMEQLLNTTVREKLALVQEVQKLRGETAIHTPNGKARKQDPSDVAHH